MAKQLYQNEDWAVYYLDGNNNKQYVAEAFTNHESGFTQLHVDATQPREHWQQLVGPAERNARGYYTITNAHYFDTVRMEWA